LLKDEFESYLQEKSQVLFGKKNALNEAILYSLLAPGKRIRPILCLNFAESFGAPKKAALACSLAVEMIHTYSLIHDDLPPMDNDDFRRGRKTNHKVFGEAMAILAGDSLLTEAPAFLLRELQASGLSTDLNIDLVCSLLKSSGHEGMALGQAMDISFDPDSNGGLSKDEMSEGLKTIHALKTGALIGWSCEAGLLSTDKKEIIHQYRPSVRKIGQMIGLLFQIVDDVLDVTASLAEIGKTPGKDEVTGKLTYTNLHGLQGARDLGFKIAEQAIQELAAIGITDESGAQNIVRDLQTKLG
jgi:geranylgeranyl diphosphate synthase type II